MDIDVKQEVLTEDECIGDDPCYGPVEILEYEQRLMLDTMNDDVIFIHGRGLGVERMFLNHLILYSDQKLLTIVLNTSPHDEAYFLSRLKLASVPCLPKVVNADVSTKDREAVYLEGGVQFLTSRIFLVDLLTDRAPVKNIACIMVYHAHQVLSSFQESFILRIYRERKQGGFVKAFTDLPTSISALGQLQRVVDRLYIKRVCLLPRFDADVKITLEKTPPVYTELLVDLHPTLRRLHSTFVELLKVCIRELKQCSIAEKQATFEEDTINVAPYRPTLLEKQLNERRSFLTDKQLRLISDLSLLRELLQLAEDMDPASVLTRINALTKDKEVFEKNGSWMMSRVATSLITDVEMLCGYGGFSSRPFVCWFFAFDVRLVEGNAGKFSDDQNPLLIPVLLLSSLEQKRLLKKINTGNSMYTIYLLYYLLAPPKWQVLGSVLREIMNIPVRASEISSTGPSVLLLVNNDAVARQLTNLINDGPEFLIWLGKRSLGISMSAKEPERSPLWDGDNVILLSTGNPPVSDPHKEMVSDLQKSTLITARAAKRRRKAAEDLAGISDLRQKQTKIVQFGILHYKKQCGECKPDFVQEDTIVFPNVSLIFEASTVVLQISKV